MAEIISHSCQRLVFEPMLKARIFFCFCFLGQPLQFLNYCFYFQLVFQFYSRTFYRCNSLGQRNFTWHLICAISQPFYRHCMGMLSFAGHYLVPNKFVASNLDEVLMLDQQQEPNGGGGKQQRRFKVLVKKGRNYTEEITLKKMSSNSKYQYSYYSNQRV